MSTAQGDVFAIPKLLFVCFGFVFLGYTMLGSYFMPTIGEGYKHQCGAPAPALASWKRPPPLTLQP